MIKIASGSNITSNHYILEHKVGPFFWRTILNTEYHRVIYQEHTFRFNLGSIYYEKKKKLRYLDDPSAQPGEWKTYIRFKIL